MSMIITLSLYLDLEVFETEEAKQVELKAKESDSVVYSWKTSGNENWMERGFSVADVFGLIILPRGLPDVIDMGDDAPEEDSDDEEDL